MSRRLIPILLVLALVSGAWAQGPSAFPETAVDARLGLRQTVGVTLGGEYLIDVPYVDASLGGAVVLDVAGRVGARISGTALLFPTLGDPPLALGIGTDLTVRDAVARVHVGVVAGLDLLFVSDLPAVVTIYVAPGYGFGSGFSLAWSAEGRYYFDDLALVVASSDLQPISVGVRIPF